MDEETQTAVWEPWHPEVGQWVTLGPAERPPGEELPEPPPVGKVGKVIRECRLPGEHHHPAIPYYVGEHTRGHSSGFWYEVWVPSSSITWWACAVQLSLVER